jgi:hypothetical protein
VTWSNLLWLVLFLIFFIWYLSNLAGRLDRLHLKAEAAKLSLDTQLAHRTSAIGRLVEKLSAKEIVIDSFVTAWQGALKVESSEKFNPSQWDLESELTKELNILFEEQPWLLDDVNFSSLLEDLAAACRRVQYARAFHNDAQSNALKVRRRILVRTFRLAGRAKPPREIDFDDQIPSGLVNK